MKKPVMFIVYVSILFALGGCSMNKSIKYKIILHDSSTENAFYHTNKNYDDTGMCRVTSKIVRTVDELILLCDENNSPAFSENSEKYNNEVNQLIRSFTEEYFEYKVVIICFGTGDFRGPLGKIKNIIKEEDRLVIQYKERNSEMSTEVIIHNPWVLIIEVNQKDIKDIREVQLLIK